MSAAERVVQQHVNQAVNQAHSGWTRNEAFDDCTPFQRKLLLFKSWYFRTVTSRYHRLMSPIYCIRGCPRPFRDTLRLLWPLPWKFTVPLPLSVEELLRNPDIINERKSTEVNYTPLRQIKLFAFRDTPLRSLYRLYECLVTDAEDEMMQESQYWFHHQVDWRLADIPDPQDTDPVRYAILASLTEALVHSFNRKIALGLRRGITNNKPWLIQDFRQELNPPWEKSPEWCDHIGPLPQPLELLPSGDVETCDNPGPFAKRNIFANFVQLYNI